MVKNVTLLHRKSNDTVIRTVTILTVFLILTPHVLSAQEDVPWLSLSRLSLTASSSYHFSPWKKYNESLQLAQDAIRYDPSYSSPKGSFEKILGDGSIELNVGYRLIEGLSINIIGGYTATGSELAFSNVEQHILYPEGTLFPVEHRINQTIKFDVISAGLGLQYNVKIMDGIQFVALANIHQDHATFNFEYEYRYQYNLTVTSTRDFYSAKLQDTRFGFNAGVGTTIRIYGPIGINSLVEYRWLKFPDLRGRGTYLDQNTYPTYAYERSRDFTAGLGEGGGYFTLEIDEEDKWYAHDYLLYRLWSVGEVRPLFEKRNPATIDLSGVGVKLGVSFEF